MKHISGTKKCNLGICTATRGREAKVSFEYLILRCMHLNYFIDDIHLIFFL